MKKEIFRIIGGGVLLSLLIFASCRKVDKFDDLRVVNYDAEFAIPLFNATATFEDILEQFDQDTYVQIDPDDLITVFYKGDVAGRSSQDILVNFPNILGFEVTDTLTGFDLDSLFNSSELDMEVDYAILKSSELTYIASNDSMTPGPLTLTLTLPNATFNGVPFSVTTNHNVTANGFSLFNGTFDLSGYKFIPQNDTFFVEYTAYRPDSDSYDTLQSLGVLIQDFEFSYIEGYLGSNVYDLERDTIDIDFFENWTRGDVYFKDPKINLIVENSFGFPVRSTSNSVHVFSVNGGVDSLESIYLDSVNVDYPSLYEVGETKYTHFDFNKDNSNIDIILGNGPVAIDYIFNAVSNPDTNTAIRGFMTDTSFMNAQVEVELPMYGTAKGFEARDTFDINFDSYQGFNDVEFKVIAENGIPIDVGLQIFFAESDGTVLDSLFTPSGTILEAAPVDGEGLPTMIAEKTTFTDFNGERFEKIKSAKKLLLRASFSTVNNGETMVKILSTQEVKIRMGMKIGVSE